MLQCPWCGAYQQDGNKRCVFCGADLTRKDATKLNDKISNGSQDTFDFSPSTFGSDTNDFDTSYRDHALKKKRATIVIASCIGIILIIIIGIILYSSLAKQQATLSLFTNEVIPIINTIDPPKEAPQKEEPQIVEHRIKRDIYNLSHSLVLEEIQRKDIITLKKEDAERNPEQVFDTLNNLLLKSGCYENSEDFVIQMDGDLESFQDAMNRIDYKKLYKVLLNKHTNGAVCNHVIPTASWLDVTIKGTHKNPQNNNIPERHATHYCTNRIFYTDNSLLDISLAFYFNIYKESDIRNMFVNLGWESADIGHYRFFNTYDVMDPYIMMTFNGHLTYADVQTMDNGSKVLFRSRRKEDEIWLKRLMQADDFQIVYGRYTKKDEGGYYYVLSYRKYSLKEMHQKCPFVQEEFSKILWDSDPAPLPKDATVNLPF